MWHPLHTYEGQNIVTGGDSCKGREHTNRGDSYMKPRSPMLLTRVVCEVQQHAWQAFMLAAMAHI